jgi:flagellar basal-body rod protein FlgB
MLDDVSIGALHAALNGLSARQRAISDDIANVNTPYYRSRSVSFEGDLRRAVERGKDPLGVTPQVVMSTAPAGLTGNNVNLPDATVASVNTQLAYELVMRATGDRFAVLRAAARGV